MTPITFVRDAIDRKREKSIEQGGKEIQTDRHIQRERERERERESNS